MQHDTTRTVGKSMMAIAWVIALGLLILFFSNWQKNAINPNQQPVSEQTTSLNKVVLKRNRYDHYITSGSINGHKVTFLLDTGASDVVIPEKLAQKLGLSRGRALYANTANGVIQVYSTQLSTLTIGDISLKHIDASINPAMEGEILLGMSALKDIEFTQKGQQLTLKQYR